MMLHALVAASAFARMRAIRELPPTDALRFALRRVLYTDDNAEVRAAAARRLADFATVEPWLLDALADHSPLVRDTILRSLARAGTTASAAALRNLAAGDVMWWVRRSAVYALAAIAGEAEVPALTAALADPFWRVRHAAIRVLAVLGAAHPDIRDEIAAAPAADTTSLAFLRASWGPVALEAPARAVAPSNLPPALLDPDPAVVTARLLDGDFSPVALVELLCDPHVPLRTLAARRIAESRDPAALAATLDWLEEPRIPHVVDTVADLLDGLGDQAHDLAVLALSRPARPGAARWAIDWVVATHSETLFDPALSRAHADPSLRGAALRLADAATLVAWASDPQLAGAIATELHDRRTSLAHDTLLALPALSARTRALQLDVLARRGELAVVEAGLADPHHGPRAIAARWLRATHDLSHDPDPAVREASLTPANAARVFLADEDPFVRRAAIDALVRTRPTDIEGATLADATIVALADGDPWIRARACGLPIVDDRALARVLALVADRDEMVRSAALDALEQTANIDARIRGVLADDASMSPVARAIARAWLARSLDDEALATLATAHRAPHEDIGEIKLPLAHGSVAHADIERAGIERAGIERAGIERAGIERAGVEHAGVEHAGVEHAGVEHADVEHADIEHADIEHADIELAGIEHAVPPVARRAFGRAGFDVAPLAISGAYDVPAGALARAFDAGVNLYFWEPGYEVLAQFLRSRQRRDHAHVITGTYHADARSIRGDVERALRKLRRETLDAFLLFWTRSAARIDDAAYGVLDALKREGKIRAIGFSTHHRELAREAIELRPWDVVMIRHSAAHPGIETALLPTARERGTAIVTFSALCYGRMISGPNAPAPSECYRYSLSQAGVTACISAPRRYRELVENLAVLGEPTLDVARIAALRDHGRGVHAESARFNALVRQPTRDAAAAAREMLAAESVPDEAVRIAMPRPSSLKRSRTRLGSNRRGR